MNHDRRLLWLVFLILVAASAAAAPLDPLTGEPIPAPGLASPVVAPPPVPGGDSRDGLTLLAHVADGTSKEVRALGGGYVVWQNGAWLEFFDVSTPTAPARVARYLLAAQPSDMYLDGTTLWVALRKTEGLLALDVTDPTAPTLISQLTGYDMLSVCRGGHYAYCGRGTPGVTVIDVADPSNPTVVTTFDTPGSANGTSVSGSTLCVAQGTSGLGLYDVSFPGAPSPLGSLATSGFCTFVVAQGDVAYLAGDFGLMIVDIAAPTTPTLLGSLGLGGTTYELIVSGTTVYVAGLSGAFRIDVTTPSAPILLAQSPPAGGFSIAVEGTAALLADRYTGLRILNPTTLAQVDVVRNAGFSNRVQLVGSLMYVVDLGGGLRIWDLTDPANPALVSATDLPANSQDVAIANDLAYVVNANNSGEGLKILDVADPGVPVIVGSLDTQNQAYGLDLADHTLYVANGFGGLAIADVTDPMSPTLAGTFALGANAFDVKAQGQVAFVALFGGGMASLDVTDPGAIALLDQQTAWGYLNAIDIAAGYAWVADAAGALRVVDINDPTNLVTIGTASTSGQARDVAWNGYVYVGVDMYGLRQFDVTDPTAPVLTESVPSADRGMGVAAAGDIVVLAAGETGVYVFQGPEPPTATQELPHAAVSLSAAPNPFNPQLTITYALPVAAPVTIAIHDAAGHLVRTFDLGQRPAGTGQVTWNGHDDAGRACASGVYALRLVAGHHVANRPVTLVK